MSGIKPADCGDDCAELRTGVELIIQSAFCRRAVLEIFAKELVCRRDDPVRKKYRTYVSDRELEETGPARLDVCTISYVQTPQPQTQ